MAEFNKVIKQLGRICESNFEECDICDLRPFCPSKTFLDTYAKSGRAKRLEEMVIKWAAEHPEPVYPTWGEWLCSQKVVGVHALQSPLSNVYYPIEGKMNTPIPADIAQKLGLQPKEE